MKGSLRQAIKAMCILGVTGAFIQIVIFSNYEHLKTTALAQLKHYKQLKDVYQNQTERLVLDLSRHLMQRSGNGAMGSQRRFLMTDNVTKVFLSQSNHIGHNGYMLASNARNVCISEHLKKAPGSILSPHVLTQKRVLYCPVEKVGTTFWRRVFYMLAATTDKRTYRQPYDVPIVTALKNTRLYTPVGYGASRLSALLKHNSFSFMFARNPYSRLLSAYIDKLVPPNPYYWKAFGRNAVTKFRPKGPRANSMAVVSGHDVTFGEFLKYVISVEKLPKTPDPHISSIKRMCKPCSHSYTYIGKMESFTDDAMFVMKKLGMNQSVNILKNTLTNYSTDDAITDSIYSPFSWKKDIVKIISWEKALQRIWLKLQMRGIISMEIKLDTSNGRLGNVTSKEFVSLARAAHKSSDPGLLKRQKDMVKTEAFASVPLADLKAFRELFHDDFVLFDYDPSPSYIFDRPDEPKAPSLFFNFNHLN